MGVISRLKVVIEGETTDISRSLKGVASAENEVTAATSAAAKASLEKRAADLKLEAAQNRVTVATARFGAESLQARNAQVALERAELRQAAAADTSTAAVERHSKVLGAAAAATGFLRSSVVRLGAAYVGFEGAKSAIDTTEELGHATLQLNKNFGLSIKVASEWSAVTRSRGIETKMLAQSFGTVSKQIAAAESGGTKALAMFHKLGVSQEVIASGDFDAVLRGIADGFQMLGAGPERTAAGMQLFGRQWQKLMPLLRGGSDAMHEQLELADKYGATLGGKTVEEVEKLVEAQREQKLAMMGIQVQMGSVLIPLWTKGVAEVTKLSAAFHAAPPEIRAVTIAAAGLGVAFALGGPLGLGITAAATAGILIATNWRQVGPALTQAREAVNGFLNTNANLGQLGDEVDKVGSAVSTVFGGTMPRALDGAEQHFRGATQVMTGLLKLFGGVLTLDFGKAWGGVKDITVGALKGTIGEIKLFTAPARTAAGYLGGEIAHGIADKTGDVAGSVKSMLHGAVNLGSDVAGWFFDLGKSLVQDVIHGIKSAPGAVLDGVKSLIPKPFRGLVPGLRAGGSIAAATMAMGGVLSPAAAFANGGLVPVAVSPGEQVIHGNQSWTVPGSPVARDSVLTALPAGAAVMTWDGQARMAMGASLGQALRDQLPHFAAGGVVSGRVSTFGPPGEQAGTTASGVSSSTPGVALRPGATFQSGRPLLGKYFQVRIGHHLATLKDIDLGPHERTGRRIDVTGAGARKLGIDPLNFPTDAIGTATPVGKAGESNTATRLQLGDRYLDSARTAGFQAGLAGDTRIKSDLLASIIGGSVGKLARDTGDTVGEVKDPKHGPIAKMIAAADRIASRGYDYVYGGGHTKLGKPDTLTSFAAAGATGVKSFEKTGFDCSGYVSAILGAAGLIKSPLTTDGLKTFGAKGTGRNMAIAVRGSTGRAAHTMMALRPKTTSPWQFYESGSGHGPQQVQNWSGTFPIRRHAQGLGAGGVVGAKMNPNSPAFVGWGLRSGGSVPSIATLVSATAKPSGEDSAATTAAFNGLAKRLADTNRVAFGQLAHVIADALRAAAAARKAGDAVVARRMDSVAQLARAEQGRRLGTPISRLAATSTRLDFAQTHVDNQLRLHGVDQGSAGGVAAELAVGQTAYGVLASKRAGLAKALERAKKLKNNDAAKAIGESLAELDQNLEGRAASLAELARQLPKQQAAERIGKFTSKLNFLALDEQSASFTPGGGDDRAVATTKLGLLQGEQAALGDEIAKALARGDNPAAEEMIAQLTGIRDEIKTTNDTLRYGVGDEKISAAQTAEIRAQVDTPGDVTDDIAAFTQELGAATENYNAAVAAGDASGIAKYGGEIIGLRGSIEQLTQTLTATAAQQKASDDLTREMVENQRKIIHLAETQPDQLIAALTSAANGGIGGSVGLLAQTPLFPGHGARY